MATSTNKQNVLVISVAVGVIVLSVFVTLYASGVLFGKGDSESRGYQNVTFTDAVMACREMSSDNYGERIRNLVTDNHSSRFDNKQFLYKIFLKMDLYDKKRKKATMHYVNCFVRSSNGAVRKYEVFEESEEGTSNIADDTNMFGMPKKKKN